MLNEFWMEENIVINEDYQDKEEKWQLTLDLNRSRSVQENSHAAVCSTKWGVLGKRLGRIYFLYLRHVRKWGWFESVDVSGHFIVIIVWAGEIKEWSLFKIFSWNYSYINARLYQRLNGKKTSLYSQTICNIPKLCL